MTGRTKSRGKRLRNTTSKFKLAGLPVAATRHGNSGGMSRKSRWITCGRRHNGKGQWKNYSLRKGVRLQFVAVLKNWLNGAGRRRKSIGCFGRHSKRCPLALSFHPPSNGQITSPCHRRQRGEPDISKKPSRPKGNTGLNDFQTFSVSASFRRGWLMVQAGGVAGRPADMAKSSEWRTNFGRFCLRRGIGFAGLDIRKDGAMPGTETGEVLLRRRFASQ
jgi:hypothetical protein